MVLILKKNCKAQVGTELHARGRSARYAREFSFARCHDEAGSVMLHRGFVGNASRTGRSTFPAAEICGKIRVFEIIGKEISDCCA